MHCGSLGSVGAGLTAVFGRGVSSLASCQNRMSELRDDLHCVNGFLARILRGQFLNAG